MVPRRYIPRMRPPPTLAILTVLVVLIASSAAAQPPNSPHHSGQGVPFPSRSLRLTNETWTNITATAGDAPGLRAFAMMDFDPEAGEPFLIGGVNNTSSPAYYYGSGWAFSGGRWSQAPASIGVGRAYSAAANDPKDGYMELFGGIRTSGVNGFDWACNPNTCAVGTNSGAPSARFGDPMTFDAADAYDVLYGGCTAGTNATTCTTESQQTFYYTAAAWTQPGTSTEPSARYAQSMVFDAADNEVILFGGINANNQPLNDTWTYKAGVWTNITASAGPAPPSRGWATMFYDQVGAQVVLFGGCDGNPNTPAGRSACLLDDTWSFQNGTWAELTPLSFPSPRMGMSVANGTQAGQAAVAFGGESNSGAALNDTWVFGLPLASKISVNTTPTDIGVPVHFAATVSGGQAPYNITWNLGDGTMAWGPSVTHFYSAGNPAYPATCTVTDSLGETNLTKIPVTVNPFPSVVVRASNNTPIVNQSVTLSGTVSGGTGPYTYAWQFGNGMTGSGTNPVESYARPGTYQVNLTVTDFYGQTAYGSDSILVSPPPPPPTQLIASMSVSPRGGTVPLNVSFGALASGGKAPYNFTWLFGDGTLSHAEFITHTYRSEGTYAVVGWVNDTSGQSVEQRFSVLAYDRLAVSLSLSANGVAPLTAVTVSAAASGGNGTLTYAWTLNGSSIDASGSSFKTTPAGAGNYTYGVSVTDASGDIATASIVLVVIHEKVTTVYPPLKLSLGLSANNVQPGTQVTVTANATGGAGGYSYAWTLNGSAITVTLDSLAVTPSGAGEYVYGVTVTDSKGNSATSFTTLVVLAPTSHTSTTNKTTSPSNRIPLFDWIILLVVVGIVLLLLGLWLGRGPLRGAPEKPKESPSESISTADDSVPEWKET